MSSKIINLPSTARRVIVAPTYLPPLPSIGDILKLYKLRAAKHLSQNFLMDPRLCKGIVRAAGRMEDGYVCEIGPGPGNISRPILENAVRHLTVIERDRRFLPALEMLQDACNGRMDIMLGDGLRHNLSNLFPKEAARHWHDEQPNIHLMGNLPFNISLPLLIRWLENISNQEGIFSFGRCGMTLTFQREVAERMLAPPATRERGRLSIMVQNYCKVEIKKLISGNAFVPKAKVDIAVVHLTPLREPIIKLPFKLIERVVKHVFMHRQKYLRNCIGTLFPDSKKKLMYEMLKIAEVDPEVKVSSLTNEEIGRLCFAYLILCHRLPKLYDYNYLKKDAFLDASDGDATISSIESSELEALMSEYELFRENLNGDTNIYSKKD